MNYEELLASRKDGKLNKTRQPIGDYYRQQIDGKYRSVVDIAPEATQTSSLVRRYVKNVSRMLLSSISTSCTSVLRKKGMIS